MLWASSKVFYDLPFEHEKDLEDAILQVAPILFGDHRIYLDVKRRIGSQGHTRNIPDGYLLDFTSGRDPKLYVVENELAKHDGPDHLHAGRTLGDEPVNDPIVDEVRQVRGAHAARFNYDLDAIFRDIKEQEKKSGRKYVSLTPPGIEPNKGLQPTRPGPAVSHDNPSQQTGPAAEF